ncbi:DUF3319 domain-containing protein [Aliivibrio fischeri]|uniref:DUF3319 domain-containing protein n=1 Tax=Aliivibrio fischeri TaxID=668 RepID=UPI0012D8B64F|nr:DUF3319 domain-containing protein [Aliivibrio fischeri]MUK62776.1 DUF3319 domain-containing protein [Aliivibrio fischeri]MUK78572.1 DUF3319 domain-containing protein [Aliivibrio fischeri]MUL22324.1 DUF3319 domain-containing protein [Aliivibrio fischeri]MUL26115.1 DUF3319 domain-containing protein [Aliivibrio fischeri]
MKKTLYKGFFIENKTGIPDDWKVLIRTHVLHGHLSAVKKSIDWWNEAGTIIDPKEFGDMGESALNEKRSQFKSEEYKGFTIKNDTGEPKTWYCLYQGKLAKGSLTAIKSFLDKHEK